MSIETELKTFNEHFGRFIKTEEEKTAAISKLADAISQAVISPAEMRMQPSPTPVLNEAKSAKVQPAQEAAANAEPVTVEEKGEIFGSKERMTCCKEEKELTEKERSSVRRKAADLCNKYAKLVGKPAVEAFISSFGWGPRVRDFKYSQQLSFIEKIEAQLASSEVAHA